MYVISLRRLIGALSLSLSLSLAGAGGLALATPVMDLRAEDLVPMAAEFRHELKLTPNQLSLWQRVESRSKAILRERQGRRERLQATLKSGLVLAAVELRDFNGAIDAETAATVQEDQQLRAMWLEVNDALDDKQRQQVASMIAEQLMRVVPEGGQGGARGAEKGDRHPAGGGKRGGMAGGMSGGMSGGMGGGAGG